MRGAGAGTGGEAGSAPLAALWLGFFTYAVLAGLLVQWVLLPYVFPAWHAGDGLLVGGDWITFHRVGVDLAEAIRREGWTAFRLRPMGQAPAGIAGAVYALTVPKPWTLVPLNAALHATAGVVLLRLVRRFVPDWRCAAAGVLPFVFYPNALTWVTQIHKDGLFVLGLLLFLYGAACLASADALRTGVPVVAGWLALVATGSAFVWLVRPRYLLALQAVGVLAALVVAGAHLGRASRGVAPRRRAVAVSLLLPLTQVATDRVLDIPRLLEGRGRDVAAATGTVAPTLATPLAPLVVPTDDVNVDGPGRLSGVLPWYRSGWLPERVDREAYALALLRERFVVMYDARSHIDVEVGFYSAGDIVRHVPRALAVALLAPFPRHWLAFGSLPATTLMRRVAGVEMVGVYLALLPLPLLGWRWRRRAELWVVLAVCLPILALLGLAVPNLGALYRFRYGLLMTLVALGVAGGCAWWRGGGRARG